MNQLAYRDYLQSDGWHKRKSWVQAFWGNRCAICNSGDHVEVHHRNYQRLGHELLTDMICLCDSCHKLYHGLLI